MERYLLFFIVTISILSGLMGPCFSAGCDNGWFDSPLCQYKCHCAGNSACSDNGACNSGCERGWFGPACQYVDLAVNGTVTRNTKVESTIVTTLTDNDMTICLDNSTIDSIVITWTEAFPFSWLRIVTKDAVALKNVQVKFRNATADEGIDCPNPGTAIVDRTTVDIHCDFYVTTKQVVLTGDGIKTLCSLYISGGRNVALKQQARQSSTYDNARTADFAVEGVLGSGQNASHCSHTGGDTSPSWNVTFSRAQCVTRYVIYNRPDPEKERLQGFSVTSYDNTRNVIFVHTDQVPGALFQYNISAVQGRQLAPVTWVEIRASLNKNITDGYLTLCEVEIFGDSACDKDKYGRDCNQTCNCVVQSEACFVSTGGCPSGCAFGYTGEDCQTECPKNTYGQNCKFNCSSVCKENVNNTAVSLCHHVTGHCLYGCANETSVDYCSMQPESTVDDYTDLIIGVVVGGGLAIIIIAGIIVGIVCWRRRRSPRSNEQHSKEQDIPETALTSAQNIQKRPDKAGVLEKTPQVSTMSVHAGPYYNSINPLEEGSTTIAVKNLDLFMSIHNKQFFKEQFEKVPGVYAELTMDVALNEENIHKNRYKNVCAYDHSRVHLNINQQKHEGDYINASYIEGYAKKEKFIASQGPNRIILDDFIRLLWEQKPDKVVMLTNLFEGQQVKCEKYWPDDGFEIFGEIAVELATTHVFADYTIRKLTLKKENQPSHSLTQFHFTSWPDKGVPITPWALVDFEQRVFSQSTFKPIIVHCSAGVGRTGTFIALHNVIKQAQETDHVDFYTTLLNLRKDRVYMVQTLEQYIFLHKAVQVAIVCLNTTVTASNIATRIETLSKSSQSGLTFLEKEFEAVCITSSQADDIRIERKDESSDEILYQNSQPKRDAQRNRVSDIVAKDAYRPFLMQDFKKTDNYINAVLVPSFTKLNGQILTQLPLPSTVLDFWRMVTQWQVSLIVAFEVNLKDTDTTVADYLPPNEGSPISCGPFDIVAKQSTSNPLWDEQNLVISMNAQSNSLSVNTSSNDKIYRVKHLKCKNAALNPDTLLKTVEQIRSCKFKNDGLILYVCRNGATYSGLACILCLLLDRMDNDHCLTVPLVVGAIKSIRPQVIPTSGHYKLLYDALKWYKETSTVYTNFGDARPESVMQVNLPPSAQTGNKDASGKNPHVVYANS